MDAPPPLFETVLIESAEMGIKTEFEHFDLDRADAELLNQTLNDDDKENNMNGENESSDEYASSDDEIEFHAPMNGIFPVPMRMTADGLLKQDGDNISGQLPFEPLVSSNYFRSSVTTSECIIMIVVTLILFSRKLVGVGTSVMVNQLSSKSKLSINSLNGTRASRRRKNTTTE